MLQFDNDLAPIVGQQVTRDASNGAAVDPRIDLMVARAGASFTSLLLDGVVTECELTVKGTIGGQPRGWVRLASGFFQRDDDPTQSALIDEPTLRALNPRLVYVSISGFGETGPYAGKRVYDPIIQGMSGLCEIQGGVGGRPSLVRVIESRTA